MRVSPRGANASWCMCAHLHIGIRVCLRKLYIRTYILESLPPFCAYMWAEMYANKWQHVTCMCVFHSNFESHSVHICSEIHKNECSDVCWFQLGCIPCTEKREHGHDCTRPDRLSHLCVYIRKQIHRTHACYTDRHVYTRTTYIRKAIQQMQEHMCS